MSSARDARNLSHFLVSAEICSRDSELFFEKTVKVAQFSSLWYRNSALTPGHTEKTIRLRLSSPSNICSRRCRQAKEKRFRKKHDVLDEEDERSRKTGFAVRAKRFAVLGLSLKMALHKTKAQIAFFLWYFFVLGEDVKKVKNILSSCWVVFILRYSRGLLEQVFNQVSRKKSRISSFLPLIPKIRLLWPGVS